jgi:hypothetical protein
MSKGLLAAHLDDLETAYMWKAENIIRFLDGLRMTKKQKEVFVARELATAYWLGEIGRFNSSGRKGQE